MANEEERVELLGGIRPADVDVVEFVASAGLIR